MAFDRQDQRKTLLYSDLFKEKHNIIMSKVEGSSSSSNPSSCFDSSSSGFSTPFGSELGSSESEDGDFIAELTRQMAECMLQEDEEEEEEKTVLNHVSEESEESGPVKNYKDQSYVDSAAINNLKYGLYSDPVCFDDQTPPLQVYQLKNQPPVSKQGPISRRGRVKRTESAQQNHIPKTEQHYMQYRVRDWGIGHGRYGHSGSGMQAVFLGGSGSKSGSCGTGVFLPRPTTDPTELKKKSGCSTVLIPTRVLQALELHFNRLQNSTAAPLSGGSDSNHSCPKDERTISNELQNGQPQLENRPANHDEEMQLPQEWTY